MIRWNKRRTRRLLVIAVAAVTLNAIFPAHTNIASAAPAPVVNAPIQVAINTDPVPAIPAPIAAPETSVSQDVAPISVATSDAPAQKHLVVQATAYSSDVAQCDSDPFTTASGQKVHDGIIAMNGLPFGTRVRIPEYFGNKVFVVQDRMNAKWGNRRIDIWMSTRNAAIQWGVRSVNIEII